MCAGIEFDNLHPVKDKFRQYQLGVCGQYLHCGGIECGVGGVKEDILMTFFDMISFAKLFSQVASGNMAMSDMEIIHLYPRLCNRG